MSLVCKNMLFLRKQYYRSQKELLGALNLSISQGTYSDYENGKNPIPDYVLRELAYHYRISLYDLKHTDIESVPEMLLIPSKAKVLQIRDGILPIYSSEKSFENECFSKAYNIIKTAEMKVDSKELSTEEDIEKLLTEDDVQECVLGFERAWTEHKDYYGLINYIVLLYRVFGELDQDSRKLSLVLLNDNRRSATDIRKLYLRQYPKHDDEQRREYISSKKEMKQARKECIDAFENDVISYISELKNNPEFADMGDYLLAIKYLLGFCQNSFSTEANMRFGVDLLELQSKIGNKYAIKALGCFE